MISLALKCIISSSLLGGLHFLPIAISAALLAGKLLVQGCTLRLARCWGWLRQITWLDPPEVKAVPQILQVDPDLAVLEPVVKGSTKNS